MPRRHIVKEQTVYVSFIHGADLKDLGRGLVALQLPEHRMVEQKESQVGTGSSAVQEQRQ